MNTRLIALTASLLLNLGFLSVFHLQPFGDAAQAAPAPSVHWVAPTVTTLATIVVTPTAAERAEALADVQ
jgi:hypothetical protein